MFAASFLRASSRRLSRLLDSYLGIDAERDSLFLARESIFETPPAGPPDGAISRYSPRPSKMRCRFEDGLTDSILIRVSIGLGATREFLGGSGGNYVQSCPRTTAAVKSFPFRQISQSPGFLPIFTGFLEYSSVLGSALAKSGVDGKSAPGRNRTGDLALRRHSLYPLSYRGKGQGRSRATSGLSIGGGEGDRTLDLRIANATLSQPSYSPEKGSEY